MYRTVGLSHTLPVFDAHEDDRRFFETEGIAILTMLISQYKVEIKDEPQFVGETFDERKSRVLASKPGLTTTYVTFRAAGHELTPFQTDTRTVNVQETVLIIVQGYSIDDKTIFALIHSLVWMTRCVRI